MSIKIAVISDIHGNRWALEAVIGDIKQRGIDNIVNLGDSLYGPLDPFNTAKILMNENIISISGNQDRKIIESLGKTDIHPTMKYVLESLDNDQMEWLMSLKKTLIFHEDFLLCHGTPKNDHKYLLENVTQNSIHIRSSSELVAELHDIAQQVILCGHSHTARVNYLPSGKTIVNPGSVGLQAYDDELPYYHAMESGSPHARYSIVTKEDTGIKIENIALPYCYEQAAECATRRNRPDWQRALLYGRV